jgi:hypothetical protein
VKQFVFISAILFFCIILSFTIGAKACENNYFTQSNPKEKNTTINSNTIPQFGYFSTSADLSSIQNHREDSLWVFAGNDTTVCMSNLWFPLSGSAIGSWYSEWTTTGDGFFADANDLITNYFPGTNDLLNGHVRLLLSIFGEPPEFQCLTDTITVTMVLAPFSNAGPDFSICENEAFHNLSGQAFNYSSLMWSTTGDGFFNNPSLLEVIYTPGQNEIADGSTVLCLVVMPNSPCIMPSVNCMTLFIQRIPVVENLSDTAVCSGSSLQLTPSVYHFDSVYWSTAGDGYFSSYTTPDSRYFPGAMDIANGQVELQLMATSGCICNYNASGSMMLTIHPHPQMYAGGDQTVCFGDTIQLSGEGQNYSSFEWLSYGDGSFDNPNIFDPKYFPGQLDNERGWVFLEILAKAFEPCNFFVGSYMEVVILGNPEANAGADTTICINQVFELQANANNFSSLLWTTSGDGEFSHPTELNSDYLPGEADLSSGSVALTLTLQPEYPCFLIAQDELMLFFDNPQMISETIEDQLVFAGESLEMEFVVQSYSTGNYSWFQNGNLITSSNSPTLSLTEISKVNAGTYHCEFSNDCGTLTSSSGLLSVLEPQTQTFQIPEGWSSMSSFVSPSNPSVSSIFEPISNQLIIVSNFNGAYWPEASLNTLGNWDTETGYSIKMESAGDVSISGVVKYPIDPIYVAPGWSFLPVKSNCTVNVQETFGVYPEIVMIKEVSGTKVFWPEMQINTLEYIIPGRSYFILKLVVMCWN